MTVRRPALVAAALGAALATAAVVGALVVGGHAPHRVHTERPVAPAFALAGLDGAPVALDALRGKVVLVDFWATWCGPCRGEVPRLDAMQRALGPRGLQVVGISMDDDAAPVRAFAAELGVTYPLALGDAALAERFGGVLGMPVKILIDRDGRIAGRHDGAYDLAALEREVRALLAE